MNVENEKCVIVVDENLPLGIIAKRHTPRQLVNLLFISADSDSNII